MPYDLLHPPRVAINWTDDEKEKCIAAANAVLEDTGDEEGAIFACIHAAGKNRKDNKVKHEYKSFPFQLKSSMEDNECWHIEGYASTYGNVDHGDDVVVAGSFDDSLKEMMPALCMQHDFSKVVGAIDECRSDEKGLWIKASLPKDGFYTSQIVPYVRCGGIKSFSIGYTVQDFDLKEGIRYLKKIKLFEVSFVTMPMNPQANIASLKSVTPYQDLSLAERGMSWDSRGAEERVREWSGSDEGPNDKYKKAFIWFDPEAADVFSGYKLQYADIVDGELKAIPRALFAIAAVLMGARGGVNISDADKEKAKAHVKRYYDKMEMTTPWEKGYFGKDDVEWVESKRDLERMLRDSGIFSKEASVYLTSLFSEKKQSDSVTNELKKITNILKGE